MCVEVLLYLDEDIYAAAASILILPTKSARSFINYSETGRFKASR